MTRRSSIIPAGVKNLSDPAKKLSNALLWLERSQNKNGSWGAGSFNLDTFICTNHVVMAFLGAGYTADHNSVKDGLAWLASKELNKSNAPFWRIAPMGNIPKYKEIVSRDLVQLRRAVENRASPHADQMLESYYVRCLKALDDFKDESEIERYASFLVDEWDYEKGWLERADTTTDCWLAVEHLSSKRIKKIRSRIPRLLEGWSSQIDGRHVFWRSPISTAYVTMNLLDSSLIRQNRIKTLLERSATWLYSIQQEDGSWQASELPYGGTGDLKSEYYPTGVIARALVAYEADKDPRFCEQIHQILIMESKKGSILLKNQIKNLELKNRTLKSYKKYFVFSILFFISALMLFFEFPPLSWFIAVWAHVKGNIEYYGAIASAIGAFCAVIGILVRRARRSNSHS